MAGDVAMAIDNHRSELMTKEVGMLVEVFGLTGKTQTDRRRRLCQIARLRHAHLEVDFFQGTKADHQFLHEPMW